MPDSGQLVLSERNNISRQTLLKKQFRARPASLTNDTSQPGGLHQSGIATRGAVRALRSVSKQYDCLLTMQASPARGLARRAVASPFCHCRETRTAQNHTAECHFIISSVRMAHCGANRVLYIRLTFGPVPALFALPNHMAPVRCCTAALCYHTRQRSLIKLSSHSLHAHTGLHHHRYRI